MCGRFTLTTNDYEAVARALDADYRPAYAAGFRPRFNVAPSDPHWIVCASPGGSPHGLTLGPADWGFPAGDRMMINARAETVHERPTFRDAFRSRRCGVVADGFLEWSGPKGDRTPHWFTRPDRTPFLFAGLFSDTLVDPSQPPLRRFTILTTEPNTLVAPHHDRMPVILHGAAVDLWLGSGSRDEQSAAQIHHDFRSVFSPIDDGWLEAIPVSKRVGDVRNDDAACLERTPPPPPKPKQQSLF